MITLQTDLASAMQEAGDAGPVLIMVQDEACFGRISQVKRAWAPASMRPHVPVQVIRDYVYVMVLERSFLERKPLLKNIS